ncbi:potassium channel family protein [Novipirellula artificiosorum]|uniref:Ion channel n=1 Tax=Novipirellula artificiosorum TaxID=2528016 RepID=A0A5C6DP89_9BACT|nr:potassium channel family protein [Novipirellula artificiosorum]TWU37461.1 Ion channel [Novipirellula artificiosorum]
MSSRIRAFGDFIRLFVRYGLHVREVLVGLLMLLVLGGVAISYLEDIPLDRAIYFAFITGLSIGYGDITPKTGMGCVVSIGIGIIGMIFVGMTVAVATQALADTIRVRSEHKR